MKNPTMTKDLIVDKLFIDLTEQDQPKDEMLLEAHEKACFSYDMITRGK